MSRFIAFSSKGATGEVIAPRFRADGSIDEGLIVVIDTAGKKQEEVTNSFTYAPLDWQTRWTETAIGVVPTGAHTYVDSNDYASYPAAMQAVHDAHVERMRLLNLRTGAPQAEPMSPFANPAAATSTSEFDPADANQDGVVTKKEQKQFDKRIQ